MSTSIWKLRPYFSALSSTDGLQLVLGGDSNKLLTLYLAVYVRGCWHWMDLINSEVVLPMKDNFFLTLHAEIILTLLSGLNRGDETDVGCFWWYCMLTHSEVCWLFWLDVDYLLMMHVEMYFLSMLSRLVYRCCCCCCWCMLVLLAATMVSLWTCWLG